MRLESPREASKFIPSTPNTGELIEGLARRWSEIGWLDLRLYRDAKLCFVEVKLKEKLEALRARRAQARGSLPHSTSETRSVSARFEPYI